MSGDDTQDSKPAVSLDIGQRLRDVYDADGFDAMVAFVQFEFSVAQANIQNLKWKLGAKSMGRAGSGSERSADAQVPLWTPPVVPPPSETSGATADSDDDDPIDPDTKIRLSELNRIHERGKEIDRIIAAKKAELARAQRDKLKEQAKAADKAKKQGRNRRVLDTDAPGVIHVDLGPVAHPPQCACCGADNTVIRYEGQKRIEFIPARIEIHERQIPIVRCSGRCDEATPVTSPRPAASFLPGAMVGNSVTAAVLVAKFADKLPLHRQIAQFTRQGVELAESTLRHNYGGALEALHDVFSLPLQLAVTASKLVQLDPTSFRVLDRANKPGSSHRGTVTSFLGDRRHPFMLYTESASPEEAAWKTLKGFAGKLLTDGTNHFDRLSNGAAATATPFHCNAHSRRYFVWLAKAEDKLGKLFTELYRQVYRNETIADLERLDVHGRAALRRDLTLPVMMRMKDIAEAHVGATPPTEPRARALSYFIRHYEKLTRFVDHGEVPPDNNASENINRVARLTENNSLFAGSHDFARFHATLWSLMAGCRIHKLDPFVWMRDALDKIRDGWPRARMAELLPAAIPAGG